MARRRAGHPIDPPFKPFKGNADEGNNRRGAIAPAIIAMAKTGPAWLAAEAKCHASAKAMSFCRVSHDGPQSGCCSPLAGIICLSEGKGNPRAERAAIIRAPARRVCRTADKTGCLTSADLSSADLFSADRQTSPSGSSWLRSVPWSSSMRCRRCRGQSCARGQFSKQQMHWQPAYSPFGCREYCGRRST